MRVAGLFAGIGGLELGLRSAGHEAVLFSEIWTPAAAVLEARFPGIPNAGDVTALKSLPTVDLLAAGFPCQDLSQAGKTAGIAGKKSWFGRSGLQADRQQQAETGSCWKTFRSCCGSTAAARWTGSSRRSKSEDTAGRIAW